MMQWKSASPHNVNFNQFHIKVSTYLTHGLFNVVNMQSMGSNSNGRSKIIITHQHNLFIYNQG
jgi:hypothetical protein